MSLNPHHRARYDAEGNIVLPGEMSEPVQNQETVAETEMPEGTAEPDRSTQNSHPLWETIEEEVAHLAPVQRQPVVVWRELRSRFATVAGDVLSESSLQYKTSIHDGRRAIHRLLEEVRGSGNRTWRFLTQPVWVPGRNRTPKQYNRGTLFLLDVVRFGGTFAFLFTILFVGMNYESFWQIAKSRIDPLHDAQLQQTLNREADGTLAEKLKRIPMLATAGRNEGDLLSVLPSIGPPVPTLIIPRLGLNVPIVIPKADALLMEDWQRLEEDIQQALKDGVVHYPGTARPGQAGNFFVTGHSSYFPWAPGKYKSVFARLGELETGDEYWIFYGGEKYRYRIHDKREVKPSDVTVLDQPMGKRLSTLMTCTPVGTTLRRLILEAEEIDLVTGTPLKIGEHGRKQQLPKVRMEMLPI